MIQCENCEFYTRAPGGEMTLRCDPFSTIKEPECLQKWQLMKINQMVACYQSMLEYYNRFAPLQEKMFKVVEREMDDINETEKWKLDEDEHEDGDEDDRPPRTWHDDYPLT